MKLLSLFATLLIKLEVVYGCTWILGDSCYNLVTDPETFFGAQAGCELLFHGYLASVTSQMEQDFLQARIMEHYATSVTCRWGDWNGIWLGGFQTNGIWTWASGDPWQFTDWGPGKPENDGTALNILWDFYAGCLWKWNDDHTEKSTPYICETKMSNNRTSL